MTQPPVPPPPGGYGAPAPYSAAGPFYISLLGQEQGPVDFNTLAQMAVSNQIKADTPVRTGDSQQYIAAKDVPGLYSEKEWLTVVLLSWLLRQPSASTASTSARTDWASASCSPAVAAASGRSTT